MIYDKTVESCLPITNNLKAVTINKQDVNGSLRSEKSHSDDNIKIVNIQYSVIMHS